MELVASIPWGWLFALALGVLLLTRWIRVLPEYERGVIFRLGRVLPTPKGPGLVLVLWPIDRMVTVSLRTIVEDIPAQDVITRDNVSIKVNAVLYFRVIRPIDAIVHVERFLYATSQLAQTTLRSVLGMVELDQVLAEREQINLQLQEIVDRQTDPWGVKVSLVELKHVDLPPEMKRAMARQAEAEREKRAKFIHAEGEFQASRRLADAAEVMQRQPSTFQLRYLQTLTELASERTSTIVFPLPVDLLSSLVARVGREREAPADWREPEGDEPTGHA